MKRKIPMFHQEFQCLCSLLVLGSFAITCLACDEGKFKIPKEPEADPFDASIVDDAGPGTRCLENEVYGFNNAYSPSFGVEENPEVVVDIVAYFRCPYCAVFALWVKDLFDRRTDFYGRVRVNFHHFPLTGHDADAWDIHAAARAAQLQGLDYFWLLHDEIFTRSYNRQSFSIKKIKSYLEGLGLDMDQFQEDFESDETLSFLIWDKEQAEKMFVRGTPTVFVCGFMLANRNELELAIDDFLSD